jgi:membrane protease YdiL (CAAX protease family)
MSLFAFSLSPDLRHDLLGVVEGTFIAFVVVSFVVVAGYTAWQMSRRRLLVPEYAPLPVKIQPAVSGWLLIASTLCLVLLHSILFYSLVAISAAVVVMQNRRNAEVQFGLNRLPIIRAQAYALLVFGAVMLVEDPLTDASYRLFDYFRLPHPEQDTVEMFRQITSPGDIVGFMLVAVVISPIIEELFFRGFLLTFLKNYTTPLFAVVLSAGVFAFAHLNLGAVIPLWFLGIVLGLAYEHTGSLLVPMTIHGCFNLATALAVLLGKGNGS